MKQPLRVSLIQTDLLWHQPAINRANLELKMAPLAGLSDLIVLPEMFTSGFTTEPDNVGESESSSPTLAWMLSQAKKLGAAITGSTVFRTDLGRTNRMWFVTADGDVSHYDKVHLFRMAGEHERYLPGNDRVCVNYQGWRLLLTVCYDLRFPVFCRSRNDYDVMLCVASWPSPRRHAWRTLLQARAIENLSYVVGVNRVGIDGKGWHFSGDSLLVDFKGELLEDRAVDQEFVATHSLNYETLAQFRAEFPAWMDADDFDIRLKQ